MHTYSTDSQERTRILFILALVSIGAAYILDVILNLVGITIPWYFEAPSALTIYAITYKIFDNWVWKLSFIHKIGLVLVPNISGEYSGEIISSFDNFETTIKSKITIKQSWRRISIILTTDESQSHSITGSILLDVPAGPELLYEYVNEPFPISIESMHIHRGAARLRISIEDDTIEGHYYSGRSRLTIGRMILAKSSSKKNR
ncbi:MAG: hypothetical protein DWQ07_13860 [Chloroflexi bacterium]|nr:MAG: hypothetical protein DWQ07_13860 [Chloroflexota bacterium]MBL1197421.1 hypothetical protein [Chloroflexota bacterium]NOH14716.1 hypothetical protein [Chloroflexota bacterium]